MHIFIFDRSFYEFSGFSDEMCMVLLALPYGDEDVKPNVAEKSVLGGPKNLKIRRNFCQKCEYA